MNNFLQEEFDGAHPNFPTRVHPAENLVSALGQKNVRIEGSIQITSRNGSDLNIIEIFCKFDNTII